MEHRLEAGNGEDVFRCRIVMKEDCNQEGVWVLDAFAWLLHHLRIATS
jgi:hypothetical protein